MTRATSKELLAVYDRPMIYYALGTLMRAGIRDIVVVGSLRNQELVCKVLRDSEGWGISTALVVQQVPEGPVRAVSICRDQIGTEPCAVVFGDNLFLGSGIDRQLRAAISQVSGCTAFATRVRDPQRYGVVAFSPDGRADSIEEKPENPKSDWAVTGLYVYDGRLFEIADSLATGDGRETSISDINRRYLETGGLRIKRLEGDCNWFDAGTPDSLVDAARAVQSMSRREGRPIAPPEEVAFRNGWISRGELRAIGTAMSMTRYGRHILEVAAEDP